MKKLIFVILLASSLLLSGCYDIGFGHNNNKHRGGDISQTYELQADGSWKGTEDGTILKGTNAAYIAELDKAPSAGGQPSNVKSISSNYEYTNTSGAAKMVIIRTTGGDLTINAPLDTVLHYGEAGTVNVIAVASSSYDGYAAITQKLVAKAGHIKLFDIIAAAIPLIEVPADATGAVAVDIPEDVVVEAVTVASAQATSIKIEGSVNTVTDTGAGTTTVEVKETGIVDKTDGVTATGDGYVADNNGTGAMGEQPDDFTSSPWKIYTPKGLAEVATRVNGGDVNDFQLERSISISGSEWTPIGTATNKFTGTFDGQGHKISGLTISGATENAALFGVISGTVTIKDVTLDVAINTTGNKAAGLIAFIGNKEAGTCTTTISGVTVSGSISGGEKVAGIVAQAPYSNTAGTTTFVDCVNNASVTATSGGIKRAGGILSTAGQKGDDDPVSNKITFTNCINTGAITGTWVGALCACLNQHYGDGLATTSLVSVSGCSNTGTLTGDATAMVYNQDAVTEIPADWRPINWNAHMLSYQYYGRIGTDLKYDANAKKVVFSGFTQLTFFDCNPLAVDTVAVEWFPAGTTESTMAANYACYIEVDGSFLAFDSVIGAEQICLRSNTSHTIKLLKDCTEDVNTFLDTPYSSGLYYYKPTAWRELTLVTTLSKNGHAYNYPSYTVSATDVFKVTN